MPHIGPTRYALGRSGWVVAGLAAGRVVLPLLVLAGVAVPGAPSFDYDGLTGDATGFYAAARELVSAWASLAPLVAAVAAACAAFVVVAHRRGFSREWVVVGLAVGAGAIASIGVARMSEAGAAVVGWPLVWAVPLMPYRAANAALDQDGAYVAAVALSLAANATTVVATAYCGLFATGRRAVGVLAAGLVSVWPFLIRPLAGEGGWANGSWEVEVGLAAYTEPLSTALVTVVLALLLAPAPSGTRLALAGAALGLATAVKLSNGLLALFAVALLARRIGLARAAPFAAAGLAFAPLVALYWPKGYPAIIDADPDAWPDDPFGLQHVASAWSDSTLYTPLVLLLLVPPAVAGCFALRRAALPPVLAWALVNPIVYSLYWVTELHPRFLFASLPAVFVLWSAGVVGAAYRVRVAST